MLPNAAAQWTFVNAMKVWKNISHQQQC